MSSRNAFKLIPPDGELATAIYEALCAEGLVPRHIRTQGQAMRDLKIKQGGAYALLDAAPRMAEHEYYGGRRPLMRLMAEGTGWDNRNVLRVVIQTALRLAMPQLPNLCVGLPTGRGADYYSAIADWTHDGLPHPPFAAWRVYYEEFHEGWRGSRDTIYIERVAHNDAPRETPWMEMYDY